MIVIKPDLTRHVEIRGVPQPVSRPVDVDQSRTGFASLRTLRMYRFEKDVVIEGHAEEDEVYVLVMAGSIELTIEVAAPEHPLGPVTLSAPDGINGNACVAYLPPGAAYKLVSKTEADVAYARAKPVSVRLPQVFSSAEHNETAGIRILFENTTYAERLRLRFVRVDAQQARISFSPLDESESRCDQLLHIRDLSPMESIVATAGSGSTTAQIHRWDTIAVAPGDRVGLEFPQGSAGLVLVVMASGLMRPHAIERVAQRV